MKVLGTDLDKNVVDQCSLEYMDYIKKKRLAIVHSNFVHLPTINVGQAFNRKVSTKPKYDIVLMDLGFSSY